MRDGRLVADERVAQPVIADPDRARAVSQQEEIAGGSHSAMPALVAGGVA